MPAKRIRRKNDEWRVTPRSARWRKPLTLTLPLDALDKLEKLMDRTGAKSRSRVVERLIMEAKLT